MFPEPVLRVAGIEVTPFSLLYVAGLVAGMWLALRLARDQGVRRTLMIDLAMVGGVAAFVAAWATQRAGSLAGLDGMPGQAMVSIPAMLAAQALWLRIRPNARRGQGEAQRKCESPVLDTVVPAVALGHAITRVGCLCAGCCYGTPAWNLPWAVTYSHPASSSAYRGVPVHPTPIYDAMANLAILALLLSLRQRGVFRGTLVWVYLSTYGCARFVIEFCRGDATVIAGALTIGQWLSLAWVTVGGAVVTRRLYRSARSQSRQPR